MHSRPLGTPRRLGALVVAIVLSLLAAAGPSSEQPRGETALRPAAATARPNIVFLMVDDMRLDELRFMPRTRSWLATGGVTFRNAIMPNPLCCPARASVLTGLHSHNHKVWHHGEPYGFHAFDDRSTMAVWLRSAGYRTTYLGKYLNGYGPQPPPRVTEGRSTQYVPPGWSQWRASIDKGLPRRHRAHGGTYMYYDTTLNNDGRGYLTNEGRYQSVAYGEIAARTVKRLAAGAAPFFSYVSFTAPHGGGPVENDDPGPVYSPWSRETDRLGTPARPARVRGRFDNVLTQAPGIAWFSEEATDLRSPYADLPDVTPTEWRRIREAARQRAEAVFVVDQQIDRIMRALRRSGELSRTLVVFTSDNGFFLGERKIRHGKTLPYAPSGRVPLLVRGPGIPAGQVRDDPYLSVDHAPTIAEASGVSPPYATDGVSMLAVARGGDQGWRRPVLTESRPLAVETEPQVRGIRTSRYLYTRWANGEEELFDLTRDPMERHNLARDPEHADVLAALRSTLTQVQDCRGLECSPALEPSLQ